MKKISISTRLQSVVKKLKECPWCGRVPAIVIQGCVTQVRCEGNRCELQPRTGYYARFEQAIHDWNTRESA
jgi:hypothetical protein